ncbi:MAG: glycosyltransferase family 39 protein [Candidatus Omnitrophica bacterium]|nr:glycosyltransferase family 39 protein [Candidatus Omnitrophota bacterium]
MSRRFLFLLIAALAARLAWIAWIPLGGASLYPFFDADGYKEAAEALHNGEFLDNGEQIKRMPLYPALTAFFGRGISQNPLTADNAPGIGAVRIWHALLDVGALACLYLFVRRWQGEGPALAAGVLYAFYPLALYRIPLMNTEIIQGAAVAFWILGASRLLDAPRMREALLLSLLSSVLAFISPALQFLPLLFAVYLFFAYPWKTFYRIAAALLIPYAAICIGWGLRNDALTGQFFLFDTRGGKEFWMGNFQEVDGRWEGPKQDVWIAKWHEYTKKIEDEGGGEREVNQYLYRRGVQEILLNPPGALLLFAKKFLRFWYVPASERMLYLTVPLQTFYLALAGVGIAAAGIRKRVAALPLFLIGYYCGLYTLSYACIRFSLPIMPWVCALAGIGLCGLWNWRKESSQ